MRFCDVTLSYTSTSGGIRTYIDAKREHLLRHTTHEHVLIVPAEEDSLTVAGRAITYTVASPILPGCAPYRFFWRPGKVRHALDDARPDGVELGSFYVSPWPVLRYRRTRRAAGLPCVVGGYFHTDIAQAYIGAPLREAFAGWAEPLEGLAEGIAHMAEHTAESYVGAVFNQCDLRLAASPERAARLHEYGVEGVRVVPLGVDLERFHPARRSPEVRAQWGATDGSLVLIYGGRLDSEKHVGLLFDAFDQLPPELDARLVVMGEGPLRAELTGRAERTPGARVLPYEQDPTRFAEMLASADVYVTAGPHETFGLSVVEAQASGLPVVGVHAGALVERVPEGVGLLAPPGDAAGLAQHIQRVAPQRAAMGTRARKLVEAHFGWRQTFDTWLSLYEGALRRDAERGDRGLTPQRAG